MNQPNTFVKRGVDDVREIIFVMSFQSNDTRRDGTKFNVERLYQLTLIKRPGEQINTRAGGRKNKNEILGLTLARLIKEKHLGGSKYLRK